MCLKTITNTCKEKLSVICRNYRNKPLLLKNIYNKFYSIFYTINIVVASIRFLFTSLSILFINIINILKNNVNDDVLCLILLAFYQ